MPLFAGNRPAAQHQNGAQQSQQRRGLYRIEST